MPGNTQADLPAAHEDRVTALAIAWELKDVAVAALEKDRDAAKEARGLRELVCDLVLSAAAPQRELLTALHALGHLLGEKGATPSYVSLTMDSARAVLSPLDAERIGPSARAAVAEGYFGALRETLANESLAAWQAPAGIVRLSAQAFAVAAHLPSREPEDISVWATGVARHLKAQGARTAHIDGYPELLGELKDTLLLAGIDVAIAPAPGGGAAGGSGDASGGPSGNGERKKGLLSRILG